MRGQRIAQQRQHITTATGWEDASQTEPGSSLMQVHPYSLRGAGVSTRVSEQALEKKKGCKEALVSRKSLRTYPLHTYAALRPPSRDSCFDVQSKCR
jgi:hypothetical protein